MLTLKGHCKKGLSAIVKCNSEIKSLTDFTQCIFCTVWECVVRAACMLGMLSYTETRFLVVLLMILETQRSYLCEFQILM